MSTSNVCWICKNPSEVMTCKRCESELLTWTEYARQYNDNDYMDDDSLIASPSNYDNLMAQLAYGRHPWT